MKRSTSNNLKTGVSVAAGFALASMLTSKVPFVQANPILKLAAPVAGALIVPSFIKGATGKSLAAGMVAAAAINAAQQYAPGLVPGVSGVPYRSSYLPGVSGSPNGSIPMSVQMG